MTKTKIHLSPLMPISLYILIYDINHVIYDIDLFGISNNSIITIVMWNHYILYIEYDHEFGG